MKKRNLLLLPLFMLVLAGCFNNSSSETPPSASGGDTTSIAPSVEDSESDIEVSDPAIVTTIEEVRALPTDSNGNSTTEQKGIQRKVTGTVTSKSRSANISGIGPAWNITLQDGNHALMLYAIPEADYTAHFEAVPVGSLLTVRGNAATYGGLVELDKIQYVEHTAGTAVVPEVLTTVAQADLAGKDSKLVKIEGLKLDSKPTLVATMDGDRTTITVTPTFRKGEATISTYMHYNIPMEDAEAVVNLLKTVTSNSTVTWTGVLGMNSGNYQLSAFHVSEWNVVVGDAPVLEGIYFEPDEIELSLEEEYESNLLATPFDGPLTGLTYESSDVDVVTVDEEGVLVAVGAGTAEVTATVGTFEATLDVTVLGEVSTDITLSVESLGLTDVAYDASDFKGETAKEVAGVKFGVFGVADYGNGLQWRQKSNSALWNETEFEGAIASITVNYNTDQQHPGKVGIYTSEDTAISEHQTAEPEEILGNEFTVTVDFDETDAIHFFRLQYPVSGHTFTNYVSEIVVTLHPAA